MKRKQHHLQLNQNKCKDIAKSAGKIVLTIAILLYATIKLPDMHRLMLRNYIGNHSYWATSKNELSGGTAWEVLGKSGKPYLMTARHVCRGVGENGVIYISDRNGRAIPRRIIEMSTTADLCLIEPMPNQNSGLSLASSVYAGERVYSAGHPFLQDLTLVEGEIVQKEKVETIAFMIKDEADAAQCVPPAKISSMQFFIFEVPVCVETTSAVQTTMQTWHGASGSAAVDWRGRALGLVMTIDPDMHWTQIVAIEPMQEFLSKY